MNEQKTLTKPCDHDGCGCQIPISQDYCNEACRMAAEEQNVGSTCECGHADCQHLHHHH